MASFWSSKSRKSFEINANTKSCQFVMSVFEHGGSNRERFYSIDEKVFFIVDPQPVWNLNLVQVASIFTVQCDYNSFRGGKSIPYEVVYQF